MTSFPGPPRDIIEDVDDVRRGPSRDEYGANPGRYCPQCHGKGKVEKMDAYTGDSFTRRCWMCGGTGSNPT